MNVTNVKIEKLLPQLFANDSFMMALSKSVNSILQEAGKQNFLMPRVGKIDELSEEILDEIAYENNIFWYYKDDPIKTKKTTIKNFRRVQNALGTPWAIRNVLTDIYGQAELIESFDDKELAPHTFSIYVASQSSMTVEAKSRFLKRLRVIKRASSVMSQIYTVDSTQSDFFVGSYQQSFINDKLNSISVGSIEESSTLISSDFILGASSFNTDSSIIAE